MATPADPPPARRPPTFGRDLLKIYGFGCLGFVVMVIVLFVVLARSGRGCLPEVDQRATSPGAAQEAVVFHFSCGIGRKGTSNVSVVPPNGAPSYPANLFSATDSTGMALFLSRADRPRVEVQWESDSVLTVRYAAGARPLLRMPAAFGVRAEYVEVSP